MAMMGPMILPIGANGHKDRPGSKDVAHPVVPFAIWQQPIVNGLMHHHSKGALASANPDGGGQIKERVPVGLTENYGGRNSEPFECDLNDTAPRSDNGERL